MSVKNTTDLRIYTVGFQVKQLGHSNICHSPIQYSADTVVNFTNKRMLTNFLRTALLGTRAAISRVPGARRMNHFVQGDLLRSSRFYASVTPPPSKPFSEIDGSESGVKDEDGVATHLKGRMLIGFTCRVCDQRTHRTISRQAYLHGVVLVECPGCKNRHLISDRLGWFEQRGDSPDVEGLMKERGEAIRDVWKEDEHGAILECLGLNQGEKK